MTSQTQIALARSLALAIQQAMPWPCKAQVDDWSDYASFRVFVSFPFTHSRIGHTDTYHFSDALNMRKIGHLIRKTLQNKSVELERLVLPKKVYQTFNYRKYPNGYDSYDIQLDFIVLSA